MWLAACAMMTFALASATPPNPRGDAVKRASVLCTPSSTGAGGFDCVLGAADAAAWTARASLSNDMNTTGWGTLAVEANAAAPSDAVAAFGAGYVEAALTADLIDLTWQNMRSQASPSDAALAFVEANTAWVRAQAAAAAAAAETDATAADTYWASVANVYAQLDGIAAGYDAHRGALQHLTPTQLLLLGMTVELGDVEQAVNASARPDYGAMTASELEGYVFAHTHCSAMIKVSADLRELYASHNTWCSYAAMLRLFKTYTLPFKATAAQGGATTYMFSGYSATIAGIDDFYITDRQLAVLETTNSVFNGSLFDAVTVQNAVPYWVRVTVATRGASTAKDWHEIFYRYNSGTYNNQWMTVDYKLFTPGEPLGAGLFWVSEQIPGFHHAEEQTMALQRGHWPSYNVPFYQDVYDKSGFPAIVRQFGPSRSYELAPRALIFRRDADSAAQDLDGVRRFMRLNRWNVTSAATHGRLDPLFPTPDAAIAARADLMPQGAAGDGRGPRLGGAIDCKIVTAEMMGAMTVTAIAGPTNNGVSGGDQPVFRWAGDWNNGSFPHFGHPSSFDFGWVNFSAPKLLGALRSPHPSPVLD